MNILCITHADFETPGVIEDWARDHRFVFKICKPYCGEKCLDSSSFDFLIILGGPQSPLKLEKYPYLKEEIALIQQAIQNNKIILGFCLGAQLIGEALDATTMRSPEKEIGVFPITLTQEGQKDPLFSGFPISFPVIHWHNDMPGETADSHLLAYSEGCPRQAIRYAPNIYGFQCHMEFTKEGIETLINACPKDLEASKYTQTAKEMLQQNYDAINQFMITILDRLVAKVHRIKPTITEDFIH